MEKPSCTFISSRKWEGGKPAICNQEHSEIKWFSRSELEAIPLAAHEYLNIIDAWAKKVICKIAVNIH
ncbi:MAG: hypothetical protein WKG06_11785 [Segetibacter sp.]